MPVIATNHGGAREQVIDGLTGRLVGRDDVAGLAAAMVALALDHDQRHALGLAGRRRIEAQFSLPLMARRYREALSI